MEQVGKEFGMNIGTVENIVNSPYFFTRDKLKDLDLDSVNSEEEANALKTNFNYRGLGKLYLSYKALLARKSRKINALKMNEKQWKK